MRWWKILSAVLVVAAPTVVFFHETGIGIRGGVRGDPATVIGTAIGLGSGLLVMLLAIYTWRQWKELPYMADFEAWCAAAEPNPEGEELSASKYLAKLLGGSFEEKFSEYVIEKAKQNPVIVDISGIGEPVTINFITNSLHQNFKVETRSDIFDVRTNAAGPIRVSGAKIRRAQILRNTDNVVFDRCYVATLRIQGSSEANVTLRSCLIGRLELDGKCANDFLVDGGSLRKITCPPPDTTNPFTGSVTFLDVVFATRVKRSKLYSGPQQYHNLRAHLEKLENYREASQMRALELAAERETDRGLNLWVNRAYRLFADYGRKPGLPLLYATAFYGLSAALMLLWDGGAPGLPHGYYTGWQTSLIEPDTWSQVRRCLLLPLQSIVNPVGIFGIRRLLVPATGWGQVVLTIQGTLSLVLAGMSVLAIRKRFKLH